MFLYLGILSVICYFSFKAHDLLFKYYNSIKSDLSLIMTKYDVVKTRLETLDSKVTAQANTVIADVQEIK